MADEEKHTAQGFIQRVLTCCVSSAILISIFSVATFVLVKISDFIIPDPGGSQKPTQMVATRTPEVTHVPTVVPPTVATPSIVPKPTVAPTVAVPTVPTMPPVPTVAPPAEIVTFSDLIEQAQAAADRGDGKATVAVLEKLKQKMPDTYEGSATSNLIETLSHRHQHKAAITALSMMEKSSKSANLWMVLAQRAFRDRDRDSAEVACLKVVSLNPKRHSAHYLLAMIYQRKGKLAEAATYAQKAITLAPTNSSYKRLLERINKRLGR